MLHIDSWPSWFLWTGRTCVNKRRQSRRWTEIVGVMKWYMQMPAWESGSVGVSVNLESVPTCSHRLRPRPRSRKSATWGLENNTAWVLWNDTCRCLRESRSLLESVWVLSQCQLAVTGWDPVREAEKVLREVLKITQRGMVKRRSYGSVQQSVFISLRPSVSFTHYRDLTPFERIKKTNIFL